MIALRIGGTIVKALVDTGAIQSLVDTRLVKQLGLRDAVALNSMQGEKAFAWLTLNNHLE